MGVEEAKESEASDTWQALEWWLASIAVHAPNSPVAIVGTHDDCAGPSPSDEANSRSQSCVVSLTGDTVALRL